MPQHFGHVTWEGVLHHWRPMVTPPWHAIRPIIPHEGGTPTKAIHPAACK